MARITVEDCLEKENNRFSLVLLAAQRAKQLLSGATSTAVDAKDNKSVVAALREIASGTVRFMNDEELRVEEESDAAAKAAGLITDPLEAILSAPPSDSSSDSDDDDGEKGTAHERNGSAAL